MAHQPSSAENLFNAIRSLSTPKEQFDFLGKMVADREEESEWLDFKAAGHIANVSDIKSDHDKWLRGEWSKYLSAFGNTGGGLVIWGIATEHDDEKGRDVAATSNHVREPDRFKARLEDLTNSATYPPINGVINLAVIEPGGEHGYVVSYVPNSQFRPHRAEYGFLAKTLSGTRMTMAYESACYYIRVGDDCGVMSHETLRHCFYPRYMPFLTIAVKATFTNDGVPHQHASSWVRFDFIVRNTGNASAKDVFLEVRSSLPKTEVRTFSSTLPLHPEQDISMGPTSIRSGVALQEQWGAWGPTTEEYSFEVKAYAENMPPFIGEVVFTKSDIMERASKDVVALEPPT